MRHADRALPGVLYVRIFRNRRHFLKVSQQARRGSRESCGTPCFEGGGIHVAEPLLRLGERRQRPVERVGRKVRTAIIGDVNHGNRQRGTRPRCGLRIQGIRVVQPESAAQYRPPGELVGKAESRLDVLRLLRAPGRFERQEGDVLGKRIPQQVVARPEV